MSDPCGILTDIQYLQHMIPHHQVALDMSRELLETSQWPELLILARSVVREQTIEIKLMTAVLNHTSVYKISSSKEQEKNYIVSQGDLTYPNKVGISDVPCDPSFFDSHGGHSSQGNHPISDEAYISHMIPHHQVAVDMSKRLLKYTSNDYMIDLAYTIIRTQQVEIAKLYALSKTSIRFRSDLLH